MEIDEINRKIQNPTTNIIPLKGFEIICEAMVYKILDLFGKNALLSMLFQIGAGPGEIISKRLKEVYEKEEFEPLEALEILMKELKEFYSLQIREVQQLPDKIRVIVENHCFLREPIKNRAKLQYGKAFCRINKGYFETAFKLLLGNKVRKIEIKFLHNDEYKDVCVEELVFYYNSKY